MSKAKNGEKYLQDKGAPPFSAKNNGFLDWIHGGSACLKVMEIAVYMRALKGCSIPAEILNNDGSVTLFQMPLPRINY